MSRFMYHGSNAIIGDVNLEKSRLRTDFGKGFYIADNLETAKNWAASKMQISGGTATIMRYEICDELYSLDGKRFERTPSLDWLEFIVSNRRRVPRSELTQEPRHSFNWVSGAIADDKVADVVESYLFGDISAEEAITLARTLPQSFQLSLHTNNALMFIGEEHVHYKQFKNNRWTKNWMLRKH